MKKLSKLSLMLAVALVAAVTSSCKEDPKDDGQPQATLSVNPDDRTVTFKAEGEDYPVIVTTNQPSWEVTLEPADSWLSVAKDAATKTFTLTAKPHTSTTAPADVSVKVTAGSAPAITITAKQSAYVEGPRLSLSPEPAAIEFDAAATKSFEYTVDTNQPSWKAESDKEWCKVAMEGNKLTLTATVNTATTSPEPATITVTAGDATPITISATQDPVEMAIVVKAAAADWVVGDKIGLIAAYDETKAQMAVYTVDAVEADGSASFAGELNWKGGEHTFYSYSPVTDDAVEDPGAVKVTIPAVQTQAGATDTHLAALGFKVAEPVTQNTPENADDQAAATVNLAFREILPSLEFRLATLAEQFSLVSLTVTAPDGEVLAVANASVDAKLPATDEGFGKLTGGTGSNTLKLNVTGRPAVPHTDNEEFVSDPAQPAGADAFAATVRIAPVNLADKEMTVTVMGYENGVDVKYDFTLAGADYTAPQTHVAGTIILKPDTTPITPIRNTNIAFGAHTTPGYGTMFVSGFRNEGDNRDYRFLTEGNLTVDWSYWGTPFTDDPNKEEFAVIKLSNRQPINQIWMRPCNHPERYLQFPKAFDVYVSNTAGYDIKIPEAVPTDDWDWGEPVLSVTDCVPENQADPLKFDIDEVTALYVKIVIKEQPKVNDTQYGSAIGEVEIYLNDAPAGE